MNEKDRHSPYRTELAREADIARRDVAESRDRTPKQPRTVAEKIKLGAKIAGVGVAAFGLIKTGGALAPGNGIENDTDFQPTPPSNSQEAPMHLMPKSDNPNDYSSPFVGQDH